jgi:outer membrane protein insertion porin family
MPGKSSRILLIYLLLFVPSLLLGQIQVSEDVDFEVDYSNPRELEIGGITVTGIKFLDVKVLQTLSGLKVGDKVMVPGDDFSQAIESLWKQGLLSDMKIIATKITGDVIFLELRLKEIPRLSRFSFKGVTKSEADKLRERIKLVTGKIITKNLVMSTKNEISKFFIDKGFLDVAVEMTTVDEAEIGNSQILTIDVDKGPRIKINEIIFHDVKELPDNKLRSSMKDTKVKRWYSFFSVSKFIDKNYQKDKEMVLSKYRDAGFRDARITWDTVYRIPGNTVNIEMRISEGEKYYFRDIRWIGNTKYSAFELDRMLNISRGDVFDQKRLDEGLFGSPSGRDITSLYMDNGYLFFQVNPVEVMVQGNFIDYEMRIYEGKQARVNRVTVTGNTKTNDRVIMREIRTQPGQLFSRADIIRTQRELAQLGYFDQEKLGVNPKPNPEDGTVDIEYVVEERPSDQLELSGGWGAGQIVGTLGLSFNNFSARNFFKKGAWSPLPAGDGQRLSLRVQTDGKFYQSYSASFTEPWLGGKKPNSLSVSVYRSVQTNGLSKRDLNRESIGINGISVGLGQRLKKPDDFFSVFHQVSYQRYELDNYNTTFLFRDGLANNLSFTEVLSRNSIDAPIYPRIGSKVAFTLQITPPWSLFNNTNYKTVSDDEKYKFIEYHKWKFDSQWYTPIAWNKLVIYTRLNFGFLGYYNKDIGQSPFERFYLGGDGLSGFSLDGREIIAQRGYPNNSLNPPGGGTIYDKYTLELRFPLSLNPAATVYLLGFVEAGNAFNQFSDYSPFDLKRAFGGGVRIFLPMFGLLGLDWGYGIDNIPGTVGRSGGQFHFTIGQQL